MSGFESGCVGGLGLYLVELCNVDQRMMLSEVIGRLYEVKTRRATPCLSREWEESCCEAIVSNRVRVSGLGLYIVELEHVDQRRMLPAIFSRLLHEMHVLHKFYQVALCTTGMVDCLRSRAGTLDPT